IIHTILKESSMKKAGIVMLMLAAFALASCSTTNVSTNRVGWSEYVDMAVKDFDSLGIISLKSEEVIATGPLHFTSEHTGSRITYADLFTEAAKKGADDIVNVRIDVQTEQRTTPFDWLTGSMVKYTYTGTALAVKYTTPIDRVESSNQKEINSQNNIR
ncbi:MAG: hypothetical protein LBK44_04320, partial [Spirochaetales bacterium]|nr:hypothetical protein [Spirochaetales bacterium]